MARHLITDLDLTAEEQAEVIDLAIAMKADKKAYSRALEGMVLGMIFEKSSTRTRVSFEAGMIQLGGQAIFLHSDASQIGRGEPAKDTGRVLSRYLDLMMIRTYENAEIRAMAESSSVPVISGLDDDYHPCQSLTDLMTIKEKKGKIEGLQLVYVGDGNNVAHSLGLAGALAGLNVRFVCPKGFYPNPEIIETAREVGAKRGATIEVTDDLEAVAGADIIYTDVWASMGQEKQALARAEAFVGYTVTEEMMAKANDDAIFMHCLPAHREEEVSEAVFEGPQSVVFDEAENRLHTQKALMVFLVNASKES